MVQPQTVLKVSDNSGVKTIRCVHVERKSYKSFAKSSNVVLGVVMETKKKQTNKILYKKGDLVRLLVVSTKKEVSLPFSGLFFRNMSFNVGFLLQPTKNKQTHLLPSASRFDSFLPFFFVQKANKSLRTMTNLFI
jgi:hypothetical protein